MPKETQPKLTVKTVLVCDDIRKEISGKDILIGVYSGIVVPQMPADLFLSFWIQSEANGPGQIPLEIQLLGPHGVKFFQVSAQATVAKKGLSALGIGQVLVNLQLPGELTLQLRQRGGEWETINKTSVEIGETAAVARLAPPAGGIPSAGAR